MNKLLFLLLSVLCLSCFSCKEGENTDLEKELKNAEKELKSTEGELSGVEKLKSMFSEKEFYFEDFSVKDSEYAKSNSSADELLALAVNDVSKKLNFTDSKDIFEYRWLFDTGAGSYKDLVRDENVEEARMHLVTFLEGNIIAIEIDGTCFYTVKKLNDKVILLLNKQRNKAEYLDFTLLIEKDYIEEFSANIKATEKFFDQNLVTKSINKISENKEEGTALFSITITNNSECNIKINKLGINKKVVECNDYDLAPHTDFIKEVTIDLPTYITHSYCNYTVYGRRFLLQN